MDNPYAQFTQQPTTPVQNSVPAPIAQEQTGANPYSQFIQQETPSPIKSDAQFNEHQDRWQKALEAAQDVTNAPFAGLTQAFGETGLGAVQGIAQLADKAGLHNDIGKNISEMHNEAVDETSKYYKDKPASNALDVAGNLAGNAAIYTGLGGGSEASYIANAIAGGVQGAAQISPDLTDRLENSGIYAGLGAVGKQISSLIENANTPATKQTAVDIAREYNIPFYREQLSEDPFTRGVASFQKDIPFSGAVSKIDDQTQAVHSALLKTIGEEGDAVTPEKMSAAYDKLSDNFTDLGARNDLNITPELQQHLNELAEKAAIIGDTAKERAFEAKFTDFANRVQSGTISGSELQGWRSSVGRLMRNNTSQSPELGELQNLVDHSYMMQMAPEDAALMASTRQQYRNMLVLERVVKDNPNTAFAPSKLQGAVKQMFGDYAYNGQSDMERLARLGNALKDNFPNSGSSQRRFNYKLLGEAGAGIAGLGGAGGVAGYGINGQKGAEEGTMAGASTALAAMVLSRYGITPYLYQNILRPSAMGELAPVVAPAIKSSVEQQTKEGLGVE